MNREQVQEIANAVLYEGYLLYPYRHSAIKNRQRWSIGIVYPREYSEANGGIEPWAMQTECLVKGSADTSLDIHIRFLHLLVRSLVEPESNDSSRAVETESAREWSLASRMANEPWQEGMEREVSALNLSLRDLLSCPQVVEIDFPGGRMVEHPAGNPQAEVVREQQPLAGVATISARQVDADVFKVRVRIENTTAGTGDITNQRDDVMLHSFVSTHTLLQVHLGTFISLLEPPEALQSVAQECQNLHTWPVLVGHVGELDWLLSSPIILYDYPQIAPESPGPLFDGTEIDEILLLRIMTLTDEEKEQMRGDERAREILERTEALTPEQFMKLHGVVRSLLPVSEGGEG